MSLDPISAVLDIGNTIITRIWPDPTQAAEAKLKLLELQQSGELAQIAGQLDINKVEAANTSLFVSGWRPFAGWVGGISLFYAAMGEPVLRFVATVIYNYTGAFPVLDTGLTLQVLLGMLGLGGLRTYEKLNNVANK
ncbi:MAG: holin family protein [Ignisphaera sp.]|nr:holin family protein [Ignisphaera sp.]